ncbi:hypothetical protein NUW58_g8615 [Xylaria curta]|uniref:Uncharacterized protein n=1 Tax=Xylaria curta TaxID=42375 RepID=A0ACC1N813_9PEZI|nr:hypothetical protein NUW58_g8615 [Xylaria curta]
MVGVPGRSKGCSTCRRRKKGCDKKRPVCTQCSSAGLECGGYERETIFLNHTQGTEAKAIPVVYQKGNQGRSEDVTAGVTDIVLPNGLAQTAYIEKYISIFLAKYLPAGRCLTTNRLRSSGDWIEIAHRLHTSDKATQLSLLSLGLFAAGESQYAIQSYCFALRKLQTTLSVPRRAQDNSTLATCHILSLYEVFHGAEDNVLLQGSRWRSHLNGLVAVIEARSPDAYQSGVSHQLFTEGRYSLLVAAIKDRHRFPLNTPEWRTIPWEKEPKSLMDKIYDIMADLSEILADTDEMRRCDDPVQKTNLHGEVLRACWCLNENLQSWLTDVGPLTDFYDSNGVLNDPAGPSDMLLAHMTIVYWAVCVILYSTLISLHDPPLSEIPINIDPLPYLQGLAKALPYFWSPNAGLCGSNLAAWPWGICLHAAYATPQRYSREITLLEQFAWQQNGAIAVVRFLDSLQRTSAEPEMAKLDGRPGSK